ncbi:5-(carboxyamino)imidazole ribonucleotide synthase [Halonatronum saccharophilum]|uniref:5-(carboxyamino)imidazole ribonucleotide synthase n=1 Tax=Halonatronum saccharophilum TaxID=150060 RepID=UPI000480CB66|nr:5-(carboxyamino)imidazole ribonucleotide synthase [Halonatronum saccharophilum]
MEKAELLKQRIGIIGGGQLGKMMILEAKKMGFYVIILDPTPHCPASSIADEHIIAPFDDEEGIRELARRSDLLTYEFEHIGVSILKDLKEEGYQIYPSPESLEIIQNKYDQKKVLKKNQIPVPEFIQISNLDDIRAGAEKFSYPLMLKSCTGGYDGKGNYLIKDEEEIEKAYKQLGEGKVPLMAEAFVPFKKEISVIVVRGLDGEIEVYPVGENLHKDNILIETKVPAQISAQVEKRAMELAHRVIDIFAGVGIFCIEMFVSDNDRVLVNEIAPRPHNSGHYSIEGSITSQFENHIRAITSLPLGSTSLVKPTVMRNLLGEAGATGEAKVEGIIETLSLKNTKVHIYGKKVSKAQRKMGHLTTVANNIEGAAKEALKASELIRIKS